MKRQSRWSKVAPVLHKLVWHIYAWAALGLLWVINHNAIVYYRVSAHLTLETQDLLTVIAEKLVGMGT